MSEWRCIGSAPQDGTHISVVNADDPKTFPATVHWRGGRLIAGKKHDAGWYFSITGSVYHVGPPTHWAPLNWIR